MRSRLVPLTLLTGKAMNSPSLDPLDSSFPSMAKQGVSGALVRALQTLRLPPKTGLLRGLAGLGQLPKGRDILHQEVAKAHPLRVGGQSPIDTGGAEDRWGE